MGLPTNQAKGQGCNPISSNCVIWQGPDIPCIDLCHGDSVTDVIAKLAKELCDILDTLNIDTYDLTCFKPICPDPENFHDLIQFLITKVCELQCCCDGTTPAQSACPDTCIVNVAPCFYFPNQLGDQITTMTLPDYVTAIGNKICMMVGQISTLESQVAALQIQQTATDNRVVILEDEIADAVVTIPSSVRLGPAPPGGWPIAVVVEAIDTDLTNLENATGDPIALLTAIQQQCVNLGNLKQLSNQNSSMGSITGWVANTQTVADTLTNMWLAVCDMRAAVQNILATCCCTDCDDVNISFTATQEANQLILWFTGSVPSGTTDCFPDGNFVTITDSNGGSFGLYVPIVSNLNDSFVIDLTSRPVNPLLNLTITIQGCWQRSAPGTSCGGLRCERMLTYLLVNTAPCPSPLNIQTSIVETNVLITYDFLNTVGTPINYTVKIYDGIGGPLVATNVHANPSIGAVNGQFDSADGILPETEYYIVVEILVPPSTTPTVCPQATITTDSFPCAAPTSVSAAKP